MQKLISIDLMGDFGFFRKPDANNTFIFSFANEYDLFWISILISFLSLKHLQKESG